MSERKKICILNSRLMLGGIESVLIDGLQVLAKEYDIEIICYLDDISDAVLAALPENVKVTYRPFGKGAIAKLLAQIPVLSGQIYKKLLGKGRWDYLLVLRPFLLNAVYAKRAKRTIYWCHNDSYLGFTARPLPLKKRIVKWVRRKVYRKYDMIWTVSDKIAQEMGACFALNNVRALPNPLNCQSIVLRAQEDCDVFFDREKTNFIMIGRMSSEKGFQRVLRFMCQQVLPSHPDAQLYLIDKDTDSPRLRQRMTQYGMADRVCLLGPQENPYPYLKQAQYLLCPSVNESFGLVMLEAMLLGVRVITTDTVGGAYVTQNGIYGCCVPNTDAALQTAVETYLENPDAYNCNLEEARQWAMKFDISYFGDRLMKLLTEE
ncbi:MAG: glycosyltransferase [Oscillospiraceae bacterium]|nr:glycosyltransferase [Oscillospiraceae bacterium]